MIFVVIAVFVQMWLSIGFYRKLRYSYLLNISSIYMCIYYYSVLSSTLPCHLLSGLFLVFQPSHASLWQGNHISL